ncbi:hypothetical protein DVW05_10010 [Clostridium botulinum]|nr:hypothetical protein [Clostridium botulinum]
MRIKSIENGKEELLIINAPEVRIVDMAEQFESDDVEGALKELALGQGNIGSKALKDIEQLKEDKTNILKTIGQVNVETDGDLASQLKDCAKQADLDNYYSLVNATKIATGTDILTLPFGNYVSTESEVTGTLVNCPTKGSGFVMKVERITGGIQGNFKRLTIKCNNKTSDTFINTLVDTQWSGWKQLAIVDDTGWIDISSTINSKAKGLARVRRISNQVFLEIQWLGIILENETIATMPSSYAPKGQSEYVFCRFAAGTITLCINGSGTIVMDYTNTGTQNNEVTCFARTSYLID